MKYLLMNKNYKLLEFEYNEKLKVISEIVSFYDRKRLPINLSNMKKDDIFLLTSWLNNRYSKNSEWYKNEQWKFNYMIIDNLIIKSYGLSLSDQYWLKQSSDKICWEDINFFDNEFKYESFIENMERVYDYRDVDVLYTPHITTGGELDKAWAIDENKCRVLYKSSNTFYGLEPINEVIAAKIGHILEVSVCDYEIKILSNLDKKTMVSSCKTFITKDTELVPASEFFTLHSTIEDEYSEYIKILESHNIANAHEKIDKMICIDIILRNTDRHLNNFGIIRDINTLDWLDIAPIYDTGRSLYTSYGTITEDANYCLFSHSNSSLKDLYSLIKDVKLTDEQIYDLRNISDYYKQLLNEYKNYTNLSEFKEDVVDNLVNKLKENIEEFIHYLQ